ncbi:glycosyltransferase, partial [bacterium]|nr:glycosyltransferase [bacterium]
FQVYQHFVESKKDSFWKILLTPLLYIDVWKIKYWELKFWRKAKRVVAVSEADKLKMQRLAPGLNVNVVSNGAGEELMAVWGKRRPEKEPTVFFQANFDWLQNIEAAQNLVKNVFPLIKKKIKNAQCWIVGQKAAEKTGYLKKDGVKIINLETSDTASVIDAYKRATVFVAPLEGPGGTRLKILAAMAAGVPVVTTKVGIEGIDAQDGSEVLIADDWRGMAEKTIRLLEEEILYRKVVLAARKLVEEKYSYKSIASVLDKIYRKVAYGKD